MCDALIPTMVSVPKSVHVIVHPNNISMPVLGAITPSLGAIPLPDDMESTHNFLKCIETRVRQKKVITIYPEAHIWPFYTKIRPFTSLSFRYPVQYEVPTFCFTNVYRKRKFSKSPQIITYVDGPFYPDKNLSTTASTITATVADQIITYVDGPFYPDKNLSTKEQREDLRNKVFNAMTERSKLNNIEIIKYIKKEDNTVK